MRFERVLSRTGLTVALSLALTPAVFSVGPAIESRFFPVVSDVKVEGVEKVEDGVAFYVAFDKVRQCKFLGVAWYLGAERVGIEFEPGHNLYPLTRPVGDQYAGPWLVRNVTSLEGTTAVAIHSCHPLWETVTPFYSGT